MSEVDEVSPEQAEGEALNGVEDKNQSRYVKRDREDSPDDREAESARKIRKKKPPTDVSDDRREAAEPNGRTTSKIMEKDANLEPHRTDDDYHIQNDSVLLNDLLADFCTAVPAPSVVDPSQGDSGLDTGSTQGSGDSSTKTPGNHCPVSEKAERDRETLVSAEADLNIEYDGELDDLFHEDFQEGAKIADLEEFRTCTILDVEKERRYTRINVQDSEEQATATVLCYGFWKDTILEKNDVVSIKAKRDSNDWIVDNENGFIVTQPHSLVSGTSIVGAHFCIRRAVIAERFRGMDSLPNLEVDDFGMTIGVLIHELLQKVLMKKASSIPEIREILDEMMSSRRTTRMLYEANLSSKNSKQQMESYVPKIYDFVARYINGDGVKIRDKNFNGTIERVREIEENVWLPQLGLKGKIDVTVETTVNLRRKTMPLEVKTGKPSFSVEHRGQLILYSMMLNCLGEKVDGGLLLYIRENIMQEIKCGRPEERDLVMLRNNLVHYISQQPESKEASKGNPSEGKIWKPMKLPEPINHRAGCVKCPYNTLCSLYAAGDENLELSESHVLKDIAREAMTHLKPGHIEYVMNWITMLQLEDSVTRDVAAMKTIWLFGPRKRESKGTCICDLEVCGDVVEEGSWYLHTFVRKDQKEEYPVTDLSQASFTDTDYVIVSTNTRINVSAGFLRRKTKHAIEMILDRDVVRQNPTATFHLDVYPYAGLSARSFASVACLLNNNDITNKLREIIIDKKPATFVEKIPKSIGELAAPLLFRLNKYQRKAVLSVFLANDYLLIKGMPGTGKTQTLVALVELLVKMGKSVLITSHTHSAVDNILLKLNERGIDFLRLGSEVRIHPALIHKSEKVAIADCKTPESLEALYSSKKIVAVTCLGATHSLVGKRIFDVCLVDESTQVLQPILLRPIYSASKFVLVGDPQQLPPVIRNDEARKMGMNESLFARLDSENNTITLKLQYRMNRRIMSVANEMTYKGSLKAGNSQVADATLTMKDPVVLESCERWVRRTLSLSAEDSVVMLNTGGTHALNLKCDFADVNKYENRVCNLFEAAIILRLVSVLLKGGVEASSIGVICPFRAQVELLRSLSASEDIEVNTVDQYQGRDKDVIFYSCTRSTPNTSGESREYQVLEDSERLNVAVTRAKRKLIIIGDKLALKRFTPFEKLFNVIKDDILDLAPGQDEFSWESLVQLIK